MPSRSLRAGLKSDEAREAMDTISIRSVIVTRSIDLQELDLVPKFSLEFVDDPVPVGHESNTPTAGRHEKVDDDQSFAIEGINFALEVIVTICHGTLRFVPPIEIHLCCFLCVLKKR